MKETTFTCAYCNEDFPISQYQDVSGSPVCPQCLEEETSVCSVCGDRIWNYDRRKLCWN